MHSRKAISLSKICLQSTTNLQRANENSWQTNPVIIHRQKFFSSKLAQLVLLSMRTTTVVTADEDTEDLQDFR